MAVSDPQYHISSLTKAGCFNLLYSFFRLHTYFPSACADRCFLETTYATQNKGQRMPADGHKHAVSLECLADTPLGSSKELNCSLVPPSVSSFDWFKEPVPEDTTTLTVGSPTLLPNL